MPWKHIAAPTAGMKTDVPPTMLKPQNSPCIKGMYLKNGEAVSDYGYVGFPIASGTATNELNGSVMMEDQFYLTSGASSLLCFTTTNAYKYNTATTTWDVITQGTEISNCEAAWDAATNVTSTRDTTIKLKGTYSAKHVIATGHTTGIASSEDNLQNTDISGAANTHLSFWFYSTIALAAGDYRVRLSEQVAGGTGATYADYNVPAITADKWVHCTAAIASPAASNDGTYPTDLNALASVALVVVVDKGAATVYLDDIRTVKQFTGDEDNRFDTCTMNDTFIITNGVDQTQKYTGSGVLTDLTTTLAAGSITNSELVISFKDHLILLNNTENGADTPQRASWTNIGALEDFTEGTAGYQDLVDDESWIVGAEQMGENEYIIYKERSIVAMIWVGGHTPFRFVTQVTGTGLMSKEAVTDVGGEHMIFGPDVIYAYKGGREINVLDDDIRPTLYGQINDEYSNRVFLAYIEEDDELQVWLPTTTNYPDTVWCYDTVKEVWYRKIRSMMGYGYYQEQGSITIGDLTGTIGEQNWTFGSRLVKKYSPITLVGDTDGKVYKLDKTTLNDDGTLIENEIQTPDFVLPDTKEYLNYFMRVPQLVFEAKGQSITTDWSEDSGETWSPTATVGNNVTSLDSIYKFYQQDFDTTTRKIRFRFRNVTVSSGFYLRYYGFYWVPRSGRR